MDGFPAPATAPPPPGFTPVLPPGQQAGAQRPVGRPSQDPDRNEERQSEQRSITRLTGLLPKDATDYRIAIFRLKGRRGSQREHRPCMRILISELEEAGTDPEDLISSKLLDKYGDRPMRFWCQTQTPHGKPVSKIAPWEIQINMDDDDDDGELDDGYGDEEPEDDYLLEDPRHHRGHRGHIPGMSPFGFAPPPPAGGPPEGPGVFEQAQSMLAAKRQEEQSNTAMMLGMFQTMQAQSQQAAQAQAAQQAQTMQLMMAMMSGQNNDREAREESRRRDEEKAASNRLQLYGVLLPALLPLIQNVLAGKEDKITPLLLTKVLEGDKDRHSNMEMIGLMSEASKQQLLMQGEMSRQNMATQSEVQKSMISHVLSMAKESVAAQRKLEENKEDGPLDMISTVLSSLGPLLSGASQPAPGPASFAQPQPQIAPPQQPHVNPPQPRPRPQPQQAQHSGQATRETHPQYTDSQWVQGVLQTVQAMEQGQMPPETRWQALGWMARVLPQNLLQAIGQDDEDQVMQITGPIVLGNQALLQWLTPDETQEFLRDVLKDLGMLLRGQVTEDYAREAVEAQADYIAGEDAETEDAHAPPPKPPQPPQPRGAKIPPPPIPASAQPDEGAVDVVATEVVDYPATNGEIPEAGEPEPEPELVEDDEEVPDGETDEGT